MLLAAGNTVLCPQSCLNLGSWATLFKLTSNCICEQTKLYELQKHSLAVATDAGVALGGLILIYFGSCCMHAYLISERVHAGYDYRKVSSMSESGKVDKGKMDAWCAVPSCCTPRALLVLGSGTHVVLRALRTCNRMSR